LVGEDKEDDGPFLAMRLFYGGAAFGPRGWHERFHERQDAERASKQKEQWQAKGRRPPGHPGRRPGGLSRADIVDCAIAIADAEGTEAVSMRRIARDLRVGAMSLYWHIESKEELHRLMLDTVHAEIEATPPSGDWRTDLAAYASNTRSALLRHPWAIESVNTGPPSGPNDAGNAERLLGTLDRLGLDAKNKMWILTTLGTYVMGAALRDVQEMRWHRTVAETTAAMTEEELAAWHAEFETQLRGSGRYPQIAKILDANFDPDAPETSDERFWFGLGIVLDGIGEVIRARSR
jgi:AcrR family transcriptional regulator